MARLKALSSWSATSSCIVAQLLVADTYERNPGLKRFLESTGLDFRAHDTFTKADIEERTALYQKLAEMIWSPTLLMKDAQSLPERT
jgi:hypothetical protein